MQNLSRFLATILETRLQTNVAAQLQPQTEKSPRKKNYTSLHVTTRHFTLATDSSYRGFTPLQPGRAALEHAANGDKERVESAGCSALLHVVSLRLFSIAGLLVDHPINPGTNP